MARRRESNAAAAAATTTTTRTSLSLRERGNPPPRRKSCAACIKAKRRCDLAVPACLRCAQRSITCDYPSAPSVASARRPAAPTPAPPTAAGSSCPRAAAANPLLLPPPPPPPPAQEAAAPLDDDAATAAWLGSDADILAFSHVLDVPPCWDLVDLTPSESHELLAIGRHSHRQEDEDEEAEEEDGAGSLAVTAPTSYDLQVAEVIAKRLSFAIDEIKTAPALMVLETQTPWCHPLLYKDGMPPSIQDVHASCALYLAKNRTNAPVILQAINSRASSLLATTPLPPLAGLAPALAHTQALLLYQTMRLFDGDILARASAERAMVHLEDAAMGLLAHVRFDMPTAAPPPPPPPEEEAEEEEEGGGSDCRHHHRHQQQQQQLPPLYPLAPAEAFWSDWILHESARRTVLFAFFFLQSWKLVTGQQGLVCDGRLGLCHSWTASRHLWAAGSAVRFARAWRDRRHFVVTDARFDEVLRDAAVDDVDRFGRMWITTLLGVDEAEGWFASRGGALRAF